jgi:hypothetical protein
MVVLFKCFSSVTGGIAGNLLLFLKKKVFGIFVWLEKYIR